jgi:hypothetical protein
MLAVAENTPDKWFHRSGREYTGPLIKEMGVKNGTAYYPNQICCGRCGGQGGSSAWAHTGWTCYDCDGTGGRRTVPAPVYSAERLATLNAIAAKKAAAKAVKKNAADEKRRELATADREAWKAANPELWAFLDSKTPKADEGDDRSEFYTSLYRQLYHNGNLSEKQCDILRQRLEQQIARDEAVKNSAHIGTVGERMTLILKVEKKIALHNPGEYNPYGPRYIFICRDSDGRCVFYKGNANVMHDLPEAGGSIVATIKEHTEYQGIKQTVLQRPTTPKLKKEGK